VIPPNRLVSFNADAPDAAAAQRNRRRPPTPVRGHALLRANPQIASNTRAPMQTREPTLTLESYLNDYAECAGSAHRSNIDNYADLQSAWCACELGDWMIWYAGKRSGAQGSEGRNNLVLAACQCARLALPFWQKELPEDLRV
jgi:hypothetical protein